MKKLCSKTLIVVVELRHLTISPTTEVAVPQHLAQVSLVTTEKSADARKPVKAYMPGQGIKEMFARKMLALKTPNSHKCFINCHQESITPLNTKHIRQEDETSHGRRVPDPREAEAA